MFRCFVTKCELLSGKTTTPSLFYRKKAHSLLRFDWYLLNEKKNRPDLVNKVSIWVLSESVSSMIVLESVQIVRSMSLLEIVRTTHSRLLRNVFNVRPMIVPKSNRYVHSRIVLESVQIVRSMSVLDIVRIACSRLHGKVCRL